MKFILLFCCLFSVSLEQDINLRHFPENFKFGVANAAPQIEGAWDEDGKGETIWDHFAHFHPEKIDDHSSPDIASDSYHKYKEDVALVKQMGLDYYRLSIAWSRILPTGYPNQINQPGVDYYNNVFAELKANGIEPMVTLYHWDLPQPLEEELGGWLNRTTADLFADYARLCYDLFGDVVKIWLTINEPHQICQLGYGIGIYAPGIESSGISDYICAYNVLLAHAKAYHIYDEEFRATQGGRIAMVIDTSWMEPGSDSDEDKEAAERALQFSFGLYANPILKGNWPQVVIDRVAARSFLEGFPESRLPEFSEEEIAYINGTYDFLAVNHYTSRMINATTEALFETPSYDADISVKEWQKPEWPQGSTDWFSVVPWGMNHLLVWLKKTYGDVEIIITENGFSDATGELEDFNRVMYYLTYLSACLDAIYNNGVNLTAYIAWSIIDDWEWAGGYTSFLGMYRVNFSDPERTRTPRLSSIFFTQVVKSRCLVNECID